MQRHARTKKCKYFSFYMLYFVMLSKTRHLRSYYYALQTIVINTVLEIRYCIFFAQQKNTNQLFCYHWKDGSDWLILVYCTFLFGYIIDSNRYHKRQGLHLFWLLLLTENTRIIHWNPSVSFNGDRIKRKKHFFFCIISLNYLVVIKSATLL